MLITPAEQKSMRVLWCLWRGYRSQVRSGDPSAAGVVVRWQPGSKTQFINVTTVATAAQRPGQQCGGSRTAVQVLWHSWGSGDVAAVPTVQQPLGTWLTAALNGDCGTGSHRFSSLHSSRASALA